MALSPGYGTSFKIKLVPDTQVCHPDVVSEETSRLRQRLMQLGERHQHQLELLLGERGPLIHGSFGTRRRVCGGENCRCTRGELHESKYLSATHRGQVRQVHVPAPEEADVDARVRRYARFKKARAELAALAQEQLQLVDSLGRSLLVPYPKDNPLPTPAPRGRPAKSNAKGVS